MDNIEELKKELWEHWLDQFQYVPAGGRGEEYGDRIIYATSELFDLDKYTTGKFPPGGRVLKQPIKDRIIYAYRLDEQSRPVHMSYWSDEFQSLYRYNTDYVECIQFSILTHVPISYQRCVVRDGHVITSLLLGLNSGGGGGCVGLALKNDPNMSRGEILELLLNSNYNYRINIKQYYYEGGLLRSADVYSEGFGASGEYGTESYSYSSAGKLERIVEQGPHGEWVKFAAKSKRSMKDLVAGLSAKIAESILTALVEVALESPLVMVQLSYLGTQNYVPSVVPSTEADATDTLILTLAIHQKRWITLNDEDFSEEVVDFMQRIESSEDWDTGTKMVRQVAHLVTEQAPARVKTAEGFFAFAVDWEAEDDDLTKMLKECGASSERIKYWKKKGWFGDDIPFPQDE